MLSRSQFVTAFDPGPTDTEALLEISFTNVGTITYYDRPGTDSGLPNLPGQLMPSARWTQPVRPDAGGRYSVESSPVSSVRVPTVCREISAARRSTVTR